MRQRPLTSVRTGWGLAACTITLLLLQACAPITSMPSPSSRLPQPPSSPASGLPSPSSAPSGLPSPSSPPRGLPSPSSAPSGLPSSSSLPGGFPSPSTTSGLPTGQPPGPISGLPEEGLPGADDDWLGEESAQNPNGGWQTSNAPGDDGQASESSQGQPDPSATGDGETAGARGELDAVLKDIDGNILAEREVLARTSPTDDRERGPRKTGDAAPGSPQSNPSQQRANIPSPPAGGGTSVADLPDAKDDDIIARQLREAAMQEQDPELKEKLWEEYRRYKRS